MADDIPSQEVLMPAKKSTDEEPELLPAPVSDDAIAAAAEAINNVVRDSALDALLAVGKIVIDTCYGGDLGAWKERGEADMSFRALAKHEGLGVSPAGLSRAVGLVELDDRLGIRERKALTATHFRAVLGLPEKTQVRLLDQAEKKGWAAKDLEAQATKARRKKGEKRGRPPLPAFHKTVNRFAKMLEADEDTFGGLEEIEEMGEDQALQLYQTVTGMKLKLETLQEALQQRAKGFATGDD
jgi:hypothetical protein